MTDKPINTLAEASDYLSRFYKNVRPGYSLDNMRAIMQYLDNPQEKFKAVHVAGTSGKTSTVYYLSALLAATGKKVGVTVSPHIDQLNERVQINNVPLPEAEFCEALTEFVSLIEQGGFKPSWFEVMIAFAYWYFAKSGVDYAVIEVGLGGLLDGTNVIARSDKVCVITDIGFDHMHVLGDTLPEIAAQKIGIVHPGNVVFTFQQDDGIIQVFRHWCDERQATLKVIGQTGYAVQNSGIPTFQLRNWQLAYEVYNYLSDRDSLEHLTSQVLNITKHVQVPARMDVRRVGSKTIVMDGAHNTQKMTAFLDSFKLLFPNAKPAVLISLKDGKDYQDVIPLLKPVASRFIITTFEANQDVPASSMDTIILLEAFKKAGLNVSNIPDQHQAYQELINGPEEVCVITGSFYLLGQIRNNEHLV
jgi:dihydrofolate synthase/folylpolyglutamate synthase